MFWSIKIWDENFVKKEQLGEFYPSPQSEQHNNDTLVQSTLTGEENTTPSKNGAFTPIAYLWTRTVSCPNPTCGAIVPLARQTWLRKKEGSYIALKMIPDYNTKKVSFERIQSPTLQALGFDPETGSNRGNTVCLLCGATVNLDYIKQKAKRVVWGSN